MRIDNQSMLEAFASNDKLKYYNACKDLSLCAVDYKVVEIQYFVDCHENPLDDYVGINRYWDGELLIFVSTDRTDLIREALVYVYAHSDESSQIQLRIPAKYEPALECVDDLFTATPCTAPWCPVYYMRSMQQLKSVPAKPNIAVTIATEYDAGALQASRLQYGADPDEFGEKLLSFLPPDGTVKLYLLRVDGEIIGFLRAENLYDNIWEIGWIYVVPIHRGKGYAMYLVDRFSRDCFLIGGIPQYNYAVNPASARLAEKCGYQCDRTPKRQVTLSKIPIIC